MLGFHLKMVRPVKQTLDYPKLWSLGQSPCRLDVTSSWESCPLFRELLHWALPWGALRTECAKHEQHFDHWEGLPLLTWSFDFYHWSGLVYLGDLTSQFLRMMCHKTCGASFIKMRVAVCLPLENLVTDQTSPRNWIISHLRAASTLTSTPQSNLFCIVQIPRS